MGDSPVVKHRGSTGTAVRGTGAPFSARWSICEPSVLPNKNSVVPQFSVCLICINFAKTSNISKLAEYLEDKLPPHSYFEGITVLQKDIFLQEQSFFVWEVFSWNGDLRSISSCVLIVAPVWLALQLLDLSSFCWCFTVPLLLHVSPLRLSVSTISYSEEFNSSPTCC